jgi:sugar/nucleoside kinase (ribokinase family)
VLTVIGDLVEDVVVWTGTSSRHGTDNPAVITHSRGGSAANVAARSAMLAPTRFVGRVGDVATGAWLTAALDATGVDVRVQRGGRTGTVVIIVDPADGERTMYPDRAAAAELEPVDHRWLVGTTLLHVPAYGFTADPAAASILAAIEQVRRRGARLSVDVSAVTVVEEYGLERFRELLDRLAPDVLLANTDEAAVLGLGGRWSPPGGVVVVKDGPRPARVLAEGRCESVPAVTVAGPRDTTGAGDAFAAGFLTAWMSGADPVASCRSGHEAAAQVLDAPGAG